MNSFYIGQLVRNKHLNIQGVLVKMDDGCNPVLYVNADDKFDRVWSLLDVETIEPIQEFNKGDLVTFRAYKDQNITAKVVDIFEPSRGGLVDSDLYTYKLEGYKKERLNSITSGRSIKESKHFIDPKKYPFKW